MSVLNAFFKGSDTKFGIFYPVHYIVAIFSDPADAQRAEKALLQAQFEAEDMIAVPGSEVIRYNEENLKDKPLGALLMQRLSQFFQTEEIYLQHDLMLAEHGAAFLAVYCPAGARKQEAWQLLQPLNPLVARYYALDGIDHLKGEV